MFFYTMKRPFSISLLCSGVSAPVTNGVFPHSILHFRPCTFRPLDSSPAFSAPGPVPAAAMHDSENGPAKLNEKPCARWLLDRFAEYRLLRSGAAVAFKTPPCGTCGRSSVTEGATCEIGYGDVAEGARVWCRRSAVTAWVSCVVGVAPRWTTKQHNRSTLTS